MEFREAPQTFAQMLAAAGLADQSFNPWPAWKVFKAFARVPVNDVLDDVTVQYGAREDEGDGPSTFLYFSREFSEARPDGAEPVCHVGCEFFFSADALGGTAEGEFWTQDYRSLEEFVDAVESTEQFQRLVNADALESSVFREEV